ncbi:MAG: metallophosphoesterase family protein [Nitrososphaerota archaeon]
MGGVHATIRIVAGERALTIGETVIVVSDIHIGYELSIVSKGVRIPSQTIPMAKRIVNLIQRTGAEEVILLGDIKDQILGTSRIVMSEISSFFNILKKRAKRITVVPGNHDAGLEKITDQSIQYASSRGMIYRDGNTRIALLHGHAFPVKDAETADILIMGHRHFSIRVGRKVVPLWIRGSVKDKQIIIMPPFNEFLSGVFEATEKSSNSYVSKILSSGGNFDAFMLDGTKVGGLNKLEDIIQSEA